MLSLAFIVPVQQGSLMRIDYSKQICPAHPHSLECFHYPHRDIWLYCTRGDPEIREKCHYFHNFNANYISFVHNQARLCQFEIWFLNLLMLRPYMRRHANVGSRNPAHQYERPVPLLLASTLAHNTLSFPLKIVSLVINTLYAAVYPRKKTLSI